MIDELRAEKKRVTEAFDSLEKPSRDHGLHYEIFYLSVEKYFNRYIEDINQAIDGLLFEGSIHKAIDELLVEKETKE